MNDVKMAPYKFIDKAEELGKKVVGFLGSRYQRRVLGRGIKAEGVEEGLRALEDAIVEEAAERIDGAIARYEKVQARINESRLQRGALNRPKDILGPFLADETQKARERFLEDYLRGLENPPTEEDLDQYRRLDHKLDGPFHKEYPFCWGMRDRIRLRDYFVAHGLNIEGIRFSINRINNRLNNRDYGGGAKFQIARELNLASDEFFKPIRKVVIPTFIIMGMLAAGYCWYYYRGKSLREILNIPKKQEESSQLIRYPERFGTAQLDGNKVDIYFYQDESYVGIELQPGETLSRLKDRFPSAKLHYMDIPGYNPFYRQIGGGLQKIPDDKKVHGSLQGGEKIYFPLPENISVRVD